MICNGYMPRKQLSMTKYRTCHWISLLFHLRQSDLEGLLLRTSLISGCHRYNILNIRVLLDQILLKDIQVFIFSLNAATKWHQNTLLLNCLKQATNWCDVIKFFNWFFIKHPSFCHRDLGISVPRICHYQMQSW